MSENVTPNQVWALETAAAMFPLSVRFSARTINSLVARGFMTREGAGLYLPTAKGLAVVEQAKARRAAR